MKADLVKFTAADNTAIFVNPAHVIAVRLPPDDDGTVRVVLTADVEGDGNNTLIVKGKLRDVARKLGAHVGGAAGTAKTNW